MARYGHTPPIQGDPSETPSGGHPWEPPPREAGRDSGARGAGRRGRPAARRAPAGAGRVQGRPKMAIFGPFSITNIYGKGHIWGVPTGVGFGPVSGVPKNAHFGGYLITLPVGTKLGPFFRAGFWDKIRGSGTEPR